MRSSLLCVALVLMAAGCHTPRTGKAVSRELAGNDPGAQIDFWHQLNDEPVASNDQAFHALLLYLDGKDDAADYNGRVASLKSRGMLPQHFDEPAEQGVRRGTLAVALMKALDQKGGITMHVVGPMPRYAVRELMFLNVYPPSTPNQAFSGSELVGIMGRVEDFQGGNPADQPAAVLPGEINKPAASTQSVRE
jgi:hypothetical protein